MLMRDHGLRIYAGGIVLHADGRQRVWNKDGVEEFMQFKAARRGQRGRVRAFSEVSRKRLELISASAGTGFSSLVTLTYHAPTEEWEEDAERNARVVRRSKRDLNRFLTSLRKELGAYLWIQEFQARGVVHYHLLCERGVEESRAAVAWCRATGELDDPDALRHAVKVERVQQERAARNYVGRYLGKSRQKLLPPGVEAGGRWWGRSRSVRLVVLDELVVMPKGETVARPCAARVVRCLRRFVSGQVGFRFKGGSIVDWRGDLARRAAALVAPLRAHFAAGAWDVEGSEVRP